MSVRHVLLTAIALAALPGVAAAQTDTLTFAPNEVRVGEQDGEATVTLLRGPCNTFGFMANYTVPNADVAGPGTATPSVDYMPHAGFRYFPSCFDGTMETRDFTIPIHDDDEVEGEETIIVGLNPVPGDRAAPVPGAVPGFTPTGVVVIEDDEAPAPKPKPDPKAEPKADPPAPVTVAPLPPIATDLPAAARADSARAPRRCASRRTFRIRLRPRNATLRSAVVTVDGKRVKSTRRGTRLTAQVDLRAKAPGRFTVKIAAKTTDGKTIHDTRRYRTCTRRDKRHA